MVKFNTLIILAAAFATGNFAAPLESLEARDASPVTVRDLEARDASPTKFAVKHAAPADTHAVSLDNKDDKKNEEVIDAIVARAVAEELQQARPNIYALARVAKNGQKGRIGEEGITDPAVIRERAVDAVRDIFMLRKKGGKGKKGDGVDSDGI